MAKLKRTAGKSATGSATESASKDSTAAQAERLGKSITESAQHIWLAGMGAFNRAQAEGSKLFESLVRDGLSLEQTARKFAGNRANVIRDVVKGQVEQSKERATDTWDKLEGVFEVRVQRALVKLGVPSREDLSALSGRIDRLTAALGKREGKPAARPAKAAKATPKVATRASARTAMPKSVKKAPAKKPRKAAAKS